MKIYKLLFIIVILPISFQSFGQDKRGLSLGFGAGVPFYSWNNSGTNLILPINSGAWGLNLYAQKELGNSWYYELNLVNHRMKTELVIKDTQTSRGGVNGYEEIINQFQLNNLILKKKSIGKSKFSLIGGAGFGLNFINNQSNSLQENGFNAVLVRDELGQVTPAYDVTMKNAERIISSRIQLHLVSKLGLNYAINDFSNLVVFSNVGYNLSSPTIKNNLPQIEYESKTQNARHNLNPWFTFLSIGWEIKIN